jgi:hypothetical protein
MAPVSMDLPYCMGSKFIKFRVSSGIIFRVNISYVACVVIRMCDVHACPAAAAPAESRSAAMVAKVSCNLNPRHPHGTTPPTYLMFCRDALNVVRATRASFCAAYFQANSEMVVSCT